MEKAWKLIIALTVGTMLIRAEEPQVKSRFVSLGLFKNGLAIAKQAVTIPGPGTYRIDDVPQPVHGTFWIDPTAGVEARMTTQLVDAPIHGNGTMDFQEELVGCDVSILFRDGNIPPATGKVVAVERDNGEDAWDRISQRSQYSPFNNISVPTPSKGFLILENAEGRTYIDTSMISYLRTKGNSRTVKQRRPVLLLTVSKTDAKPMEIYLSYLTQGISWAPGYRVDLAGPKTLMLEQNAVVKNELADIENAEIMLISGYPNIPFSNVISPFSLSTTWAQYFRQLNQRNETPNPTTINSIRQNAPSPNSGASLAAAPAGEGVDLHYQSLGIRTLAEGDSLAIGTASGKASYERIVEWIVPDTRDANGHYIQDYRRQEDPGKYEDATWDAVRFKNPLSFPMTTAPVIIVSNGRFNGQQMTDWVNTGEETTLHITKALSLRTYHMEQEEPGEREIVNVGGNDYRVVRVKGELKVNNHRNENVSLVIRRRFSGDLKAADDVPTCVLMEEGAYSVNRRNELTWSLSVKPGEEKTLTYHYSVLVDN
jgi:hypothetical protein